MRRLHASLILTTALSLLAPCARAVEVRVVPETGMTAAPSLPAPAAARAYRQGLTGTTAAENLDAYTARFLASLRERLGPPAAAP